MNDDSNLIAETTARIFADLADPQTLNADKGDGWSTPLWSALEEAGLTRAWIPEEAGGVGLPLAQGFEILRISGQYACPVPLAETLLAAWCLSDAGLSVPVGKLSLIPMRDRDRIAVSDRGEISGTARAAAHVDEATHLVAVDRDRVALVMPDAIESTPRRADMGGGRLDLRIAGAQALEVGHLPEASTRLMQMGAVARACQMAGALETALHITAEYTQEREAFGRKIAKFQAVQQNLARLAGEVAAALTASGSAAETLETAAPDSDAVLLEVAAAKIRCGEAVETGAAIVHQAHGAIGWTQEHILQRFTRRMWGWRDDFGAEAHWAERLGTHVASKGADALWPMLTSR